jgi:hypothetical protein
MTSRKEEETCFGNDRGVRFWSPGLERGLSPTVYIASAIYKHFGLKREMLYVFFLAGCQLENERANAVV